MSIPTINNSSAAATDSRSAVKLSSGQTTAGSTADNRPASDQGSSTQARTDAVSISTQAVDLQALEARIRDLPDVDTGRITELREKISSGQYIVDSSRLADRILSFEKIV